MDRGWKIVTRFVAALGTLGSKDAIYRGQPDWDWELVPSAYRPKAVGIHDDVALQEWKRRAARFASPLPRDEMEWLVLAQHYGLATSLLDWTSNPLVALFFACDGDPASDCHGCVWRSERRHFQPANHTLMISPFRTEKGAAYGSTPFLLEAVGRNARSSAQDSILSHHPFKDDLMLTADRIFEVQADDKIPTLNALEKLGITGERLLVDITRLVARIKSEMSEQADHTLAQ